MTNKEIKKSVQSTDYQPAGLNVNSILSQNQDKVNGPKTDYEIIKSNLTLKYTDYHGSVITHDKLTKIILDCFSIKYEIFKINGNRNYKYYKFNEQKDIYEDYNILDIGRDIHLIVIALNSKNKDIKHLSEQVLHFINTGNHEFYNIKPINLAPNYLIKFNNGIYNRQENKFFIKNSPDYKNLITIYDFINMFDFDYLSEISDNDQYLLVYNKLIKDLSDNNEDQILLFNQLVSAVIEGNGRGKYIMLSGQAGSGKTTFGNILKHIAGEDYTRYVTMDSFDDDNTINSLSMSTRLILGDDLQKSAKLVGRALRYFKTLVDGNQLSVSVKYEPNRIIQTTGLWLQMMNDNPSIYEANDAIKDRTILVNITGKNHRKINKPAEREFSKRLDLYTGKQGKADENFIQTVVSYILNTVDYFEEFTISDEMRAATEEMVDDANWAKQFVEYLFNLGILDFNKIPSSDIRDIFYYWAKHNNPVLTSTSARTISSEISPFMKLYGFRLEKQSLRIKNINNLDYNRDLIEEEFNYLKLNSTQSNLWVKTINPITTSDIETYLHNIDKILSLTYYEISFKDKIIIDYLSKNGNTDILQWKLSTEN